MNRSMILPLFVGLTLAGVGAAGEMKASRDFTSKTLKSYFSKYPLGTKAIQFDADGLHFVLTSATKKPEQVGIYSYVSIAGDFQVSANYVWTPVEVPKDGYGVSVGLAVETDTIVMSFARGNFQGKKSTYVVTQGRKVDNNLQYINDPWFPTKALRGQMVMRREKDELVFLTQEGKAELEEKGRVPFSNETVRKVRFFADPGGVPTSLDARFSKLSIKAEEITTQIPESELAGWSWWPIGLGVAGVAAILGFVVWRRRSAA